MCCTVLHCVALCCTVSHRVALRCSAIHMERFEKTMCVCVNACTSSHHTEPIQDHNVVKGAWRGRERGGERERTRTHERGRESARARAGTKERERGGKKDREKRESVCVRVCHTEGGCGTTHRRGGGHIDK